MTVRLYGPVCWIQVEGSQRAPTAALNCFSNSAVFTFCASLQYFEHVEEAEWAVQVLKASGKPVAATLCIGPEGDLNGVSPGDCAVRLVKAGTTISRTLSSRNLRKVDFKKMFNQQYYLILAPLFDVYEETQQSLEKLPEN